MLSKSVMLQTMLFPFVLIVQLSLLRASMAEMEVRHDNPPPTPRSGSRPQLSDEQLDDANTKMSALHIEVQSRLRDFNLEGTSSSLQNLIELRTNVYGSDDWLARTLTLSRSELDLVLQADIVFRPAYVRAELARSGAMEAFGAGEYATAMKLLRESLALLSRILGEGSFHYAVTAECYGLVQLRVANATGKREHLQTAVQYFDKAAKTYGRLLTANDPGYAGAVDSCGLVALALGDYAKAKNLFNEALHIRRSLLGPMSTDTAISLQHLAMLYTKTNELPNAAQAIEDARAICEATDSQALSNECQAAKAHLLALQGDYVEAAELYATSINFVESSNSNEHPDLIDLLSQYGKVLRNLGRVADADRAETRSRRIKAKITTETTGH